MTQNDFTPTPQLTVADLLMHWPQAVPIFLRRHMVCPGCSMAAFESLEDAARIYGVDLNQLLSELRGLVKPE